MRTCVPLKQLAEEGFKGKAEQTYVIHTHGRLKPDRVALLGLGSSEKYRPEVLRAVAGRAGAGAPPLTASAPPPAPAPRSPAS